MIFQAVFSKPVLSKAVLSKHENMCFHVYSYIKYYAVYVNIKGNIHPGRFAYIFKFGLTWSPFTYSMTLDAYHIDSVNTCYD